MIEVVGIIHEPRIVHRPVPSPPRSMAIGRNAALAGSFHSRKLLENILIDALHYERLICVRGRESARKLEAWPVASWGLVTLNHRHSCRKLR
jgi:hypothetical protein